ncbi:MAG TPA: DUF2877 domain-containing protein, partial [Anaerolineales bacterium]|nr:DUF2877 domain-containing protein [Anaerolineales bacterium]
ACASGHALLQALSASSRADLRAAGAALAGLGGGFTPAGDDFLTGAMMALWALRDSAGAGAVAGTLAQAAVPRTTAVSAAWLDAAARGEATESWHRFLEALAAGQAQAAAEAEQRILAIGHTSGEDALLGFLLSAETLAGSTPAV